MVYGDTNSTLAGSLAASKLHIRVAHVEAGLRSFNRRMPEEINRLLTDHLSTLHFCPTTTAVENLSNEGIRKGATHVGDVMFDATIFAVKQAGLRRNALVELPFADGSYSVATVHRAENTEGRQQLLDVVDFLKSRAKEHPVVLPLHPRTRKAATRFGVNLDGLTVVPPLGYLNMTKLVSNAEFLLTQVACRRKHIFIAFPASPCATRRNGRKL